MFCFGSHKPRAATASVHERDDLFAATSLLAFPVFDPALAGAPLGRVLDGAGSMSVGRDAAAAASAGAGVGVGADIDAGTGTAAVGEGTGIEGGDPMVGGGGFM